MAKSTAQSHATLIREMARETSRSSRSSRHSGASHSPQPTLSDFDPENEAIMSTQQLDNHAQHLPALRASAQKYNRFSRPSRPDPPVQSEPDYAIDTSAIGRAFPDFSQGGTSSDDGSMSIEVGRGAKKTSNSPNFARSKEYSSDVHLDIGEDSLDFAAPMIGDYIVTATPPLRSHRSSKKVTETTQAASQHVGRGRGPSGLRQEISRHSSPVPKTKDYGISDNRKGSREHGATLASIHARVRDEFDVSQLEDDRPATIDLTARNTRFASGKQQIPTDAVPSKFSSTKGLMTKPDSDRQNGPSKATGANAGTQQSFLLPEMPNMSELISGVFENGTPVFPRHTKSRASRFAKDANHADIDEIPVPEDEQAIFLSLKLLQDKIAILEKNEAENELVINELEQKNKALESERVQQRRRVSQRSDSALGTSESEGEERKLTIEKNRLESSVRMLQNELDTSHRKATTVETILRKITQERDSAVSQLSVAYITIKNLEAENEDLKEENRVLRGPTQHTFKDSGKPIDVNTGQVRGPRALNDHVSPSKSTQFTKNLHRQSRGVKAKSTADLDIFDLTPRPRVTVDNPGTTNQQDVDVQFDDSEASVDDRSRVKVKNKKVSSHKSSGARRAQNEDETGDLTYLSFLDSNEVAKLRRTLEQEHIERKQRLESKTRSSKVEDADDEQHTNTAKIGRDLPRKSSMKNLTSRSIKEVEETTSAHTGRNLEQSRRHSEPSLLSTRSRRHGMNNDNMTSAFIVPDITIRGASDKEKELIEELAQHSGENCTVCKSKDIAHGIECIKITIPKPVPVSERVPIKSLYEDEPTIRPSQAPGLALATVIKGLEDEVAHLKIQLVKYQTLYSGHDPALSKRKRKSVQTKIESLLQTIDVKSDQIYALFDVLEGQKQDDQEMSEEEVEITLQSVGIDLAKLNLRGGGDADEEHEPKGKTPQRRPWDLSSEDEDDELPWEGIESTVETTKNSSMRVKRRSGVV